MGLHPNDFEWSTLATGTGRTIEVRWLGVAGFEISCDGVVLLIDPYVTRAPLWQLLFSRLEPDAPLIRSTPPRADGIIVGHSHFDHVMDVPTIAHATGAQIWGSKSTANLMRACGIDAERVHECTGGERFEVGPFSVRMVPSLHSKFALGRVPMPGDIPCSCEIPLRSHHYRCGQVFGIAITVDDVTLYHCGSADLIDDAIEERDIDLLLMCIAARHVTDRFIERTLGRLRPRLVVPHHYDNFLRSTAKPMTLLPKTAFGRFVDDVYRFDRQIEIATLPFHSSMSLRA